MEKPCATCGEVFHVKNSHAHKRHNCSMACMAESYKTRLRGSENPNHRDLPGITCKGCGDQFQTYQKGRKFCSKPCHGAWVRRENAKKPLAIKSPPPPNIPKEKNCERCSQVFIGRRDSKYCDGCRNLNRGGPKGGPGMSQKTIEKHMHSCKKCDAAFWRERGAAKYCSYECFVSDDGPLRAGTASMRSKRLRGVHKEDYNQKEIVKAFEKFGALVMDLASVGGGCPDLFVMWAGRGVFVEVKNPETAYGRRGLNKNQLRLQSGLEANGCQMQIARTVDDVQKIMKSWKESSNAMG